MCSLGRQREVVLGRVLSVARGDPVWEEGDKIIIMAVSAHMSQQWAIEANRHKQDVPTLSACYQ
jgi:hypothetical protein